MCFDAEHVENPETAGNPLGGWAYRFGDQKFRDLDGSLIELISYAGS